MANHPREPEAATLSSLNLTVTGSGIDALFRAEFLVNWNLFTDSPTDDWSVEYFFFGMDTYGHQHLRTWYRDVPYRAPRRVMNLVNGNGLRWADEEYDYNVFQPKPDEVRVRIRLRRNGVRVYTLWSNQVSGYF